MTRTTKHLIATAALLPLIAGLSGCSASGISQAANMIDQARKVQKTAKTVENVTGQDMGLLADPLGTEARAEAAAQAETQAGITRLANAEAIDASPMPVEMRKTGGKMKALAMKPKIAVAGYNVAAFTEGKITGNSSGDLLGYSQGSRTTIELAAQGIDTAMVQRIADAASADLVAQLDAAGFDVIAPASVAQAENNAKMKAGQAPKSGKITTHEGAKMVALVAGPSDYGYRGTGSNIPMGFAGGGAWNAGNAPAKLSQELDAVIVTPAIVLDFADLKARGMAFTTKSSASANLAFSLDRLSTMSAHATKSGRYVDSSVIFGTKKGASSEADFAYLGEKDTSSNTLERGLGAALGMATKAKKTTTQTVVIDPQRYEALALSAARGWNAAFVQQVVQARSASS